jgi:hypothetical protein
MTSYRPLIRRSWGTRCLSVTPGDSNPCTKGGPEQEVFVAFSPRFERLCLESRKRSRSTWSRSRLIPRFGVNTHCLSTVGRRSRLRTEPEQFRSRNSDACSAWNRSRMRRKYHSEGAPLPVWPNFQQRALDVAILEIASTTFSKRQALISGFL